jgi:hypothetical protein
VGCDDAKVIPEEKFIKVYVDLLIIKDTTTSNQISPDSLKSIVFAKHNISAEDYESTISNYHSSPEKWEEFFNKAIAYVEELRTDVEK